MKKIIFLTAMAFCSLNIQAQYITIKNRQFVDSIGQPFYPVIMAYLVHIVHNGSPIANPDTSDLANYFLAPDYHYGATRSYDCNDASTCLTEITEDFQKLKDLGFNTIRFSFGNRWDTLTHKFRMRSFQYCVPIDICWDNSDLIDINQPYSASPIWNFLLTKLDTIISIATSSPLNLKIAIEVGNGSTNNTDPAHANDYTDLLTVIGNHYKTNTSLINYTIASEVAGVEDFYVSKNQVCSWTSPWYDSLKAVDPHHLISTTGYITDVLFWDPAVIKSDFFELHSYPWLKPYEKVAGYDEGKAAADRFRGYVYWLRNYCPKPFMVGETGFMAADYTQDTVNYPQNPLYYNGTLAQQHYFADSTFQSTVDCNGMAYNWWNYQDDWNGDEVGFGLLTHGAIPSSPPDSFDKPVAEVFDTVPTPNICSPPANYRDPYNCGMFNTSHTNHVMGTLVDNNGNGIPGGVLQALSWLYFDDNATQDTTDDKYVSTWLYSYADDNGNFEVIPYNYINAGDDRIVYIRGSAPSAEKFETPAWTSPYGWTDIQITPSNLPTSLTTLQKINFGYDGTFDGETILQTEQKDLKGWNSVTVNNTTIDGTSDITARQEINIHNEFHASNTSEVHIFPSDVFIDCNLTSNFYRFSQNYLGEVLSRENDKREIEIAFSKRKNFDFAIIPNPNSGSFSLEIFGNKNNVTTVTIKSIIGNVLSKFNSMESVISLDLHDYSKGIYLISVITSNNEIVKKLVIN